MFYGRSAYARREPIPPAGGAGGSAAVAGAYGKGPFGGGAYGRGMPVATGGSSGTTVTANAGLGGGSGGSVIVDAGVRGEGLATQVRWANSYNPYPMVNHNSSLASGMVGAYFPGYGAPVVDATGAWNALATSAYGTAGALTSNGGGRSMSFSGQLNGLWYTGSGMPLGSATQFTIACLAEIIGPTHAAGGTCFALTQSSNVSNRIVFGWSTFEGGANAPPGYGWFYFNVQMNAAAAGVISALTAMPTGPVVMLATFDTGALTASFYINGSLVAAQALPSGSSLSGFDTISVGCRVTSSQGESGMTIANGSATMTTSQTGQEDTTVGSPATDPAGYIPAGTYCTGFDLVSTYTLSQAVTGSESNFTITWLGPFTRLMNGEVNLGATWNRILTGSEIASFSANPAAAFLYPEGAQIEALSTPVADAEAPAGLQGTVWRVGAGFLMEFLTSNASAVAADTGAIIEWLGRAGIDPRTELESLGHALVVFDDISPMESVGGQRADANGNAEATGAIRRESPTNAETGGLLDVDALAQIEALGLLLRDVGILTESVGGLLFRTETVVSLEALLSAAGDTWSWVELEPGFLIPATLLSVDEGRILATPGRIRLLKAR